MGKISAEDYGQIINEALNYIKTGSRDSVEKLQKEMEQAAENLEFEKAAVLRDRINNITRASQTQKIFDPDIDNTDIIASVSDPDGTCVSVIVYRNGKLVDKNSYFFEGTENDSSLYTDFIMQYYSSGHDIPEKIFTEYECDDAAIISGILKEQSGHAVHVNFRQKGSMMKYIMLARNNASEYLSVRAGRTVEIKYNESITSIISQETALS